MPNLQIIDIACEFKVQSPAVDGVRWRHSKTEFEPAVPPLQDLKVHIGGRQGHEARNQEKLQHLDDLK